MENRQQPKEIEVPVHTPSENILWLAGIAAPFGHKWHFTILTTGANDSMAPYHSRMPVLLQQNELDEWDQRQGFLLPA